MIGDSGVTVEKVRVTCVAYVNHKPCYINCNWMKVCSNSLREYWVIAETESNNIQNFSFHIQWVVKSRPYGLIASQIISWWLAFLVYFLKIQIPNLCVEPMSAQSAIIFTSWNVGGLTLYLVIIIYHFRIFYYASGQDAFKSTKHILVSHTRGHTMPTLQEIMKTIHSLCKVMPHYATNTSSRSVCHMQYLFI